MSVGLYVEIMDQFVTFIFSSLPVLIIHCAKHISVVRDFSGGGGGILIRVYLVDYAKLNKTISSIVFRMNTILSIRNLPTLWAIETG